MKVVLILTVVLLTAAGAFALGRPDVAGLTSLVQLVQHVQHAASAPTEPATMLLSGSALLALAGAVRRFAA